MASSPSCLLPMQQTLMYMQFSWADFTSNSGLPLLGSSLESLISSPSPFKTSLEALPTHGLESLYLVRWSPSESTRPGAVKVAPWSKNLKIVLTTPALKPFIDNMGFPVPFIVHVCYWRKWAEHCLHSCPINESTRALKSFLITLVLFLSTSSLPAWTTISG